MCIGTLQLRKNLKLVLDRLRKDAEGGVVAHDDDRDDIFTRPLFHQRNVPDGLADFSVVGNAGYIDDEFRRSPGHPPESRLDVLHDVVHEVVHLHRVSLPPSANILQQIYLLHFQRNNVDLAAEDAVEEAGLGSSRGIGRARASCTKDFS